MIRRVTWLERRLSAWAGYSMAVLLPLIALLLQILLRPVLQDLHFFLFFPAVMLTAAAGGLGPGLAASAVGAILAGSMLFPSNAGLPTLLGATFLFVLVSGALVFLIHSLKVLLVERTESMQRENLLRRELQHRVGNFAQLTLGLARMQAKAEPDPGIRAALDVFRSRIQAFAQAQQEILNPERRPLADVLADICRMQTRSFFGGKVDCEFDVDKSLLIAPDQLQSIALIVNELVLNSLKHAFEDGDQGTIRIEVKQPEPEWLSIDYTDTGKRLPEGFDPAVSTRSGLRIIHALADQLGGQFEVVPSPVKRFRIRFRLRAGMAQAFSSAAE
jgi:two-component system, sensor histidine kinase PdtaS